jgi:hypothetical protein
MVTHNGTTPAKLPMEVITDTLASIQREIVALGTLDRTLQHIRRLVVRATLGLAGGMLLWTAALLWWTTPPVRPNYMPAFQALDTVLVDTWKVLPKEVQAQLTLAYRAGGVRPPGDRDKK